MTEQTREQWLEERRKSIGGSDSPVIVLDDHPYMTKQELYLDKIGLLPPKEETPQMRRGKMMEDIIATLYTEKTGRKLEVVKKSLRNSDYPFISGNIDRKVIDPEKGEGVAEFKTYSLKNYYQCKREGVYDHVQIQTQHYMGLGFKWASIVIFNPEVFDILTFDIDRDDALVEHIYNECAKFWEHVVNRVPPEDTAITEHIRLPKEEGKSYFITTEEWASAVAELKEIQDLKKEIEGAEVVAKDKIQGMMDEKEVECAEGGNARVYYSFQNGRKTFDKDALKKDYPAIDLGKYEKAGKPFKSFKIYYAKERY